MKPRRRLLLLAPQLPTISECLEDVPPPCLPQSLDEYAASIRALARPTSALPGPIRSPRGQRPHPHARARHPSSANHTCRTLRPRHDNNNSNNINNNRDLLDWPFAQTNRNVQTNTRRYSQTDVRPRTQTQCTGHTENFLPTLWML